MTAISTHGPAMGDGCQGRVVTDDLWVIAVAFVLSMPTADESGVGSDSRTRAGEQ